MANAPVFIKHIKRKLSGMPWFSENGLTTQTIYRQYLPQVKNPSYPCLTLAYEIDQREVFADVDDIRLYVMAHTKEFDGAEVLGNLIADSLHKYTYSDDTLIVYNCLDVGIPTTPSWNRDQNCWDTIVEFTCSVGN